MKKLIFVLTSILLTVGCRKDDSSVNATPVIPQVSQTGTGATAGMSGQSTNQGGGVDSSGGDLMTSSEAQVATALENIESKTYLVAARMAMELTDAEKTDFEQKFGANTYVLTRDLLKTKGHNGDKAVPSLEKNKIRFKVVDEACEGDHQSKAGSARWTEDGQPEICLAKKALSKMSPQSLQIDVLALAMHEVAHLFGYDEQKAQAVQAFVLSNKGLLWPHADQLKLLLNNANDLLAYSVDLVLQFDKGNDDKQCETIRMMSAQYSGIFRTRESETTIVIPSMVIAKNKYLFPFISNLMKECEKSGAREVRKSLADKIAILYSEIMQLNTAIRTYANPSEPGALLGTFEALDVMALLEHEEIIRSISPSSDPQARVEMENVVCKIDVANEKGEALVPQNVLSLTQFYGDKTKGMARLAGAFDQGVFMFRRVEGQRGIGFALMSKEYQVVAGHNMFATSGGKDIKQPMFASTIAPGLNESFKFIAKKPGVVLKVTCGHKQNGKVPELKLLEEPKNDDDARDANDDYFLAAPTKPTDLRIRLNKPGQDNALGGADLGVKSLKSVRFNGNIILQAENDNCIIPEPVLSKKQVNALQLAQDIRDGKFTEVICDMNGDTANGRTKHAAWAFEYGFKNR